MAPRPTPYVEDRRRQSTKRVRQEQSSRANRRSRSSGCAHPDLSARAGYKGRVAKTSCSPCCASAQSAMSSAWLPTRYGAPTWSNTIAALSANVLAQAVAPNQSDWWEKHSGVYHLTASGSTSWHGFAEAGFSVFATREEAHGEAHTCCVVSDAGHTPEQLTDVERQARSPALAYARADWRDALRLCMSTK